NVDGSGNLVPYSGGMTVQYQYDRGNPDIFQQGNLLWEERTPGPRAAAQSTLRTTYTYEPVFNQPATITDPRSHVTSLSYDYQEGNWIQLTAAAPGTTPIPASVDPAWWDAATIQPIQNYLLTYPVASDPNGDGYHRGGNPILSSEGTATDFEGDETEEM